MASIEIRGWESMARAGAAMQAAAVDLGVQMGARMGAEASHTSQRMVQSIGSNLPKSGGLAAATQQGTTTATHVEDLGLVVKAKIEMASRYDLAGMNDNGTVIHPVYNDGVWVTQTAGVNKGFLDNEFHKSEPALEASVVTAVEATRATIYRSI